MSFYSDASLVMIPSGYKNAKVYSAVPTDGSADLTFSRASNATRVASNGLIEKVRTNIALHSNNFSNAAWAKLGQGTGTTAVVTSNYTADPFGGNNGWRLQCDLGGGTTTSDRSWLQQTIAGTTVPTTVSVYAKLNSVGSATFALSNADTTNVTITSTDWVRISTVRTSATTSYFFRIGLIGGVGQDNTLDISIAFAQLETGDIATDYIATTTTAVSVGPVSGLPRLDYLNSSCPRLLLEPQRTSNVQFSEAFDNAYWSKPNVTLTSTLGGPIDQSKYFTITCDGTAGTFKGVRRTFINASANTYTISVFAKAGNSSTFVVSSRATLTDNDVRAIFNLSNGTITDTNGGTAAIVPYGDGWYRCSFTVVNAGTFSNQASIFFGHPFGAADGATVLATGAMSEIGAYPSSYIPTLSTSVTRVADAASKTGISSLIGQTEGTFYAEWEATQASSTNSEISLSNGSNSTAIRLRQNSANAIQLVVNNGGATQASLTTAFAVVVGSTYKIAGAYKVNDFVLYVNGVQIGTDTSGTVPACSQFGTNNGAGVGNADLVAALKQALLFTTRLTNQQLQELTTL